jgi:glc operon protein GlcG
MRMMLNMMIGLIVLLGAAGAAPQTVTAKKTLTLEGARQVIAAIVAEAKKHNVGGAIAVVDDGGNLMAMERLDGTFAMASTVAIGKARTAAMFKRPTKFFEEVITVKGRTSMIALDDFTPLQGGVPLIVDDQVVGAVGVSGAASAQQDEEFAVLGAAVLEGGAASMAEASLPTTYFASVDVTAAFAAGRPLIENGSFKVHASRREKPGQAEVHADETDIIYVLQGTATVVTGGQVVGGRQTAPGETRGDSISGGETRSLRQGDVVIVPAGTPHWFKDVGTSAPFLYYVVKVIQ